jgi:hypothetical protein
MPCTMSIVFQKELYNSILNITVRRVLRKRLLLKAYKLFAVQGVERWIVRTPLRVIASVTLAAQKYLEYYCKVLFETSRITSGSNIES